MWDCSLTLGTVERRITGRLDISIYLGLEYIEH